MTDQAMSGEPEGNWARIQRLARRVLKEAHPDRGVQQSWADELATAVTFALAPVDPVTHPAVEGEGAREAGLSYSDQYTINTIHDLMTGPEQKDIVQVRWAVRHLLRIVAALASQAPAQEKNDE